MLPAEGCARADIGIAADLRGVPRDNTITGQPGLGQPVVLVVEDENIVRMAAVILLHDAGYATVEATSGPGAMVMLEEALGIRIVLTDIDMPQGFDGITLAACVHRRWPGIGIVMTSGKVAPVPGDVPEGAVFLRKPYAETELLTAIRRSTERPCNAGACQPDHGH
ncbi:response regulator [Methylobacterium sp. D54C]